MKKNLIKLFAGLSLLSAGCSWNTGPGNTLLFYAGSSSRNLEHAIFLCELDLESNRFALLDSFAGAAGASYLAFSPEQQYLYAINNEICDTVSGNMTVTAFRVDPDDHSLILLNSRSSEGKGPCHLHCSQDGKFLFAANYNTGNIAVFPLTENGLIEPASCVVQSSGSGPVKRRQEGPHTHYVTLDPDGQYLLSPDLGADKILVYLFDPETGMLTPNPRQPFLQTFPGSGPRHLDFHPSGSYLYIVNELDGTVTSCSYDSENGVLEILNRVSTVPETYTGMIYSAAIRVHPGGKFLYASNRGERNSIAVFRIREDGTVTRIQVVEDIPAWPRDFNIDPSGKYLLAAGERSGTIRLYMIDPVSGLLEETGQVIGLPSPACIVFIE